MAHAAKSGASAASRLTRLSDDVARRVYHRPLDEPEVGPPGGSLGMVAITTAVRDSDRAFRDDVAQQLNALKPAAASLTPELRADLAVLELRLARWTIERDELRCFQTDPVRQWPRIDGSIRRLLSGRPGALCRRLKLATRRLEEVPEMLREASVNLEHPSPLAVESALVAADRTLALYRSAIPAAVRDCREPVNVADLAEADTLAAKALETYVEWMRANLTPRADGTWAMGEERYARWLRAATGDTTPVAALAERAARELATAPAAGAPAEIARADTIRAARADSLLAVHAARLPKTSSHALRAVLGQREAALPWADFAARVAARDPAARFAPSRLDLAAMLVEIDLHRGAATFDEARRRLETDAGLDSATADLEARRAAIVPSRAVTVVAAWRLEELRTLAARRLPRYSAGAFLAAVMEEGALPFPAIREPVVQRLRLTGDVR